MGEEVSQVPLRTEAFEKKMLPYNKFYPTKQN